jgi:hypothetical protein
VNGRPASRERGASLVTALVFLTVIRLFSITSMRSSTIGVRMAQNEEARLSAIQSAQAMTEAVIGTPAWTPVIGDVGFTNCTAGEAGCDVYAIGAPVGYVADQVAAGNLSARVQRLSDQNPPRSVESSLVAFSAASYQVVATFDRSDEGLGRAQLTEGLLILVPK